MKKRSFLKKLNRELRHIDNFEREKIINRYSDKIDSYIALGESESNAVELLGNIDIYANEAHITSEKVVKDALETTSSLAKNNVNINNSTFDDENVIPAKIFFSIFIVWILFVTIVLVVSKIKLFI